LLRYAILQLLYRNSLTGYEIKKRFDTSLIHCWHASHSQIYPELHRMEQHGLVVAKIEEQIGKPNRNVYTITEAGKETLRNWISTPIADLRNKDEMLLKVFSIHLMEPKDARELLLQARELHVRKLAFCKRMEAELAEKNYIQEGSPTAPWIYGRLFVLKQGMMYEQMYIDWIDMVLGILEKEGERIFPEQTTAITPKR